MARQARSPLALAALATAAVPGLEIIQARPLALNSADYEVVLASDARDETWVVRAPLSAEAGAKQDAEVALLDELRRLSAAGTVPFGVPNPEGFADVADGLRVMVYRQLPGHVVDVDALRGGPGLAAAIGAAIAALHSLPLTLLEGPGLPTLTPADYRTEHLHLIDRATLTGAVPEEVLQRWEVSLRDQTLWDFTPRVIHGELTAEHLWTDGVSVTGMVDFFDAKAADPAEDLSWLLQSAPIDAADAIFESYAMHVDGTVDDRLWQRAALLAELAIARWLLFGKEQDDTAIVADAEQMLAELAASLDD